MTDAAVLTEMQNSGDWYRFAAWAFGADWWRVRWLAVECEQDGRDELPHDMEADARWYGQFSLSVTGCI